MYKIAVSDWVYEKIPVVFKQKRDGFAFLSAPCDEGSLCDFIEQHGIDHLIIDSSIMAGRLYKTLKKDSVISRFGVGYENIDLALADDAELFVANTPGKMSDAVAELCFYLILSSARKQVYHGGSDAEFKWELNYGTGLHNKTLAIIGCGSIGSRLAEIAAFGFKMRVIGCKRNKQGHEELIRKNGFAEITTDLSTALKDADFVSINTPGTKETRHLINKETLALMKTNAVLINSARGSVVNESDLYDALVNQDIAGAALDVFENEPYRPVDFNKDLRTLDSVIMSSHIGSLTREAYQAMAERSIENILHAIDGDYSMMNLLNRQDKIE
ncbi:MAG: NAD(P)-binding domain-containing protein [Lentisphaeria bacterium]|nr:NAD(P)-binding domain-containing protein [Lentisphaeria bacterium]